MASKQKFIARANPKNLGPQLMLLIRDKKTDTWKKICAETGLPFNEFHTAHSSYWGALNSLKEAGLVTFERDLDDTKYGYTDIGKIKISKNWHLTQQALDVSLSRLSGLDPNEITVKPLFGPPSSCIDAFDVFVMMPFDGELDPIYEDHLKKVCANQELSIGRGDDAFTTEAVMLDIWSQIHLAKIAIADCTGRNPNVFYELGLAHALGKPVIVITQDSDDVPFDIRHIRYIQYEYTPRGMKVFEDSLEKTIIKTIANVGNN